MKFKKGALTSLIGFIPIAVIALLVGIYLYSTLNASTTHTTVQTSTTTSSTFTGTIQGVVTGYVTVCTSNQTCNENMTGYSVVFTPQCSGSSNCQSSQAALSPAGHYEILLPPGNYSVTGLLPSCKWTGCSTAFPSPVNVQGGNQLVLNIEIPA